MPRISPTCIALVKNFEGFRREPLALPDGRWLLGYGHVCETAPAEAIDERQGEQILKDDLEKIAQAIERDVLVQVSQCQFDALCCFVYSIGVEAFASSDVLRFLNAGHPIAAASAMEAWRMGGAGAGARVVLDALVRRRAVEKSLFLYEGVRASAPSALIAPDVDPAIAAMAKAMVFGSQSEDETARKVHESLGREPQTANALKAPAQLQTHTDEGAPQSPSQTAPQGAAKQRDLIGHAALGALGLLLIAMGVTGAGDDHGVAHIVFTAPGIVASLLAAFYLLRSAAT